MTIQAKKIYVPLFICVLLLQLYLPSFRLNIVIQLFVLVVIAFIDRVALSHFFLKHLNSFILLTGVACIGTIVYQYQPLGIIKDIFHFLKPIVGILIGYLIFKRINDVKVFAGTIVGASIISAVIHFAIIFFLVRLRAGSLSEIREFTKDNFLELFGLILLIFYKRYYGKHLIKNNLYRMLALILIILSACLYFSRTMIVAFIILLISIYGYTRITTKSIKIFGALLIALALFYTYLFNANIKRDKPGLETFLYKIKIAPSEVFTTNIDRENHADLWDHWRGYEAKRAFELISENPASFVFGAGLGSVVNLKFYAPLGDSKKGLKYISELHNGYVYIFYKTGIVGLLIYLFIIARWYMYIYKRRNFVTVLISAIAIIYLFSTITITGMYNNKDIIIVLMGALLYFVKPQQQKLPDYE